MDLLPSPSGSGNKSHTALVGMVLLLRISSCRHIDGHHKLIRWKLVIHGGWCSLVTLGVCTIGSRALYFGVNLSELEIP